MDFNLKGLAKTKAVERELPAADVADLRHRTMLEAIAPYAKETVQKNLTPVYIDYKTRNTKLVLVLCPEWAPNFPPFNLARLSGVAKTAGYETHIMDLNIRVYNEYIKNWKPKGIPSFPLWDPSANWHWRGDTYINDIHPIIEPMLSAAVDEIIALNPEVVGFSMYYISEEPTKWMCQELKRKLPNVKIAVGGSNVQQSWFEIHPYYDYVVSGEGEQALLQILEEVELGIEHTEPQHIRQPEGERININGLPMPDYESIDFSQYDIPNGVNTEFSRGCTAKCVFCDETHFWKYRQRQAVDLIQEIEWLYYNKGTDIIWFIDSLVNGNLKELRAFSKAVSAKQLDIKWTGYARCDGRMDLEYFKDLKAGGCIMLNYGIESGSQKVLDDMAKGVTIAEMEQNLLDGNTVGVFAATNWIIGFPTEEPQDFADTMAFLWRMRTLNVNNVGAGTGYGLGPETIVGQNPEKFRISAHKYQGHWIRDDFTMGGTHMMVRVKSFNVFLDVVAGSLEVPFGYPVRPSLKREHYSIKFDSPETNNPISYERFDYNIITPNINPYADSLLNEIWPLLRMLWKTKGGYQLELRFNPTIDLKEFGNQYDPGMFTATYKFRIDANGQWSADFKTVLDQIDNPYDTRPEEEKGPFFAQDYSRLTGNSAARARRLAHAPWATDAGRNDEEFSQLIQAEWKLNAEVDFSFNYHYVQTGDWSNFKEFEVHTSTTSNFTKTSPITFIKK